MAKLSSPHLLTLLLIFTFCNISVGFAYVGPGAGISLLGSLLGVLLAIGALLVFIIVWPIRRAMKKRKKNREDAQ